MHPPPTLFGVSEDTPKSELLDERFDTVLKAAIAEGKKIEPDFSVEV